MQEINVDKINETIYYDECPNGLKIYMWINEKASEYYATLNVKYGSIDTKFKVKDKFYEVPNGVAHFLEHIKFNEPDGKTANEYFDKLGSSINAFTTFDFTSYQVYGTTNIFTNINHLLDYVETPVITPELVKKEAGIIKEEVKMGANIPSQKLFYAAYNNTFHNDKHKNRVTGSEEDVAKITSQDLLSAYNNFYHPTNMFIIITGNFNPYEMAAMIKENQSLKKYNKYLIPKIVNDSEDISVVKPYQEIMANIEIPKLALLYKIPRRDFKGISDDKILNIYLRIILNANFGPTSDFKEDLMEKELITFLGFDVTYIGNYVIIEINCETKYPHELIKILKDKMHDLNITSERLRRRIKCNIANFISTFDDIEFINNEIQDNIICYGKIYPDLYNILLNLDLDIAKKVIKQINLDNLAITVMLPEKNTND
jgi:predicted Zn-dependent peptidase